MTTTEKCFYCDYKQVFLKLSSRKFCKSCGREQFEKKKKKF